MGKSQRENSNTRHKAALIRVSSTKATSTENVGQHQILALPIYVHTSTRENYTPIMYNSRMVFRGWKVLITTLISGIISPRLA